LVVWKSKLSVLELHAVEILEIYEDVEVDDSVEVFGPLIELDLGEGSSIHDVGETPIEAAGVAPSVVVEVEDESSVKFVEAKASLEKKEGDQAKGTGSEPVLESVEKELRDQAVEARGEPAHDIEVERTGAEPVLENVEDRFGTESDLMKVEEGVRTRDKPVHEVGELRTGKKHVPADVEMGTGDMPVREIEVGDSHYEDFQGDDFKVGEFVPEDTPQTPADPAPEISSEQTPSSAESQRKRIKTFAGRMDLPWVLKLITQKSKTSSSSQ